MTSVHSLLISTRANPNYGSRYVINLRATVHSFCDEKFSQSSDSAEKAKEPQH